MQSNSLALAELIASGNAIDVATLSSIVNHCKAQANPNDWERALGDWAESEIGITSLSRDAVKALDGDRIGGLAVRFGSPNETDISQFRDYFTKNTDYWIDAWDRRPILYHHAMDESTADDPVIGTWTKATVTDEGVWLEGELSKAYKYQSAIKELVRRGALRISTDSAPHLVRRAAKSGAHEVTRWPIVAASLTVSPAEPRLHGVSFKALLAELGLDAIDSPEANDPDPVEVAHATKTAADDRARRLLLTLDVLALETT